MIMLTFSTYITSWAQAGIRTIQRDSELEN